MDARCKCSTYFIFFSLKYISAENICKPFLLQHSETLGVNLGINNFDVWECDVRNLQFVAEIYDRNGEFPLGLQFRDLKLI